MFHFTCKELLKESELTGITFKLCTIWFKLHIAIAQTLAQVRCGYRGGINRPVVLGRLGQHSVIRSNALDVKCGIMNVQSHCGIAEGFRNIGKRRLCVGFIVTGVTS